MADVRALLAAERQSRRITHPHLSYTKSGILLCNVCNLNVKSEALWEGHLRSANHRKNVLASQETTTKPQKRKIEDLDLPQEDPYETGRDGRKKKPKSRTVTLASVTDAEPEEVEAQVLPPLEPTVQPDNSELPPASSLVPNSSSKPDLPPQSLQATDDIQQQPQPQAQTQQEVDEDEWAAFEREVAPLAVAQEPMAQTLANYEGATITAAPMSAAQIAQQADEDKRRRLDTEAEDEKEDEGRRLEEEFDVMEEMEERVRKLREKREALRNIALAKEGSALAQDQEQPVSTALEAKPAPDESTNLLPDENHDHNDDNDDDDDDDDEDDWYR